MKKSQYGFTLSELIVVISIISIISIIWVFSFISNGQKQDFIRQLSTIENTLSFLDTSVWKNITDYSLSFYTGAYYSLSVNELYKDAIQKLSFSWNQITLSNTTTQTGIYQIFVYKDEKFQQNFLSYSTGNILYEIQNTSKYQIKWYLNDQPLNTLEIIPYWYNRSSDENDIVLVNWWWKLQKKLYNQKQFFPNFGTVTSTGFSLLFEKKSFQHILELK